jgi:hypothetical protein
MMTAVRLVLQTPLAVTSLTGVLLFNQIKSLIATFFGFLWICKLPALPIRHCARVGENASGV